MVFEGLHRHRRFNITYDIKTYDIMAYDAITYDSVPRIPVIVIGFIAIPIPVSVSVWIFEQYH